MPADTPDPRAAWKTINRASQSRLHLLCDLQVQSLPNLTGFLTIGTTACLTALGITIAKLAQHPVPGVRAWIRISHWSRPWPHQRVYRRYLMRSGTGSLLGTC